MDTFLRYPTLELLGADARHELVGEWRSAIIEHGEGSAKESAARMQLVAHDEAHGVRPRFAARVVVLDAEERVLTFTYSRGRILLPGGGCDEGETFGAAAVREVWEETTRAATIEAHNPLLLLYHAILPDGDVHRVQYALIFRADLDDGPLETDGRPVRWLGAADRAELAPRYPLFPGIEGALAGGTRMPIVMLP